MNEKVTTEKILEAIKRLDEKKPSEWNAALILQVKSWLFPKIKAVLLEKNGQKNEDDLYKEAEKIFKVEK